jgi:hypothetical protein
MKSREGRDVQAEYGFLLAKPKAVRSALGIGLQ